MNLEPHHMPTLLRTHMTLLSLLLSLLPSSLQSSALFDYSHQPSTQPWSPAVPHTGGPLPWQSQWLLAPPDFYATHSQETGFSFNSAAATQVLFIFYLPSKLVSAQRVGIRFHSLLFPTQQLAVSLAFTRNLIYIWWVSELLCSNYYSMFLHF